MKRIGRLLAGLVMAALAVLTLLAVKTARDRMASASAGELSPARTAAEPAPAPTPTPAPIYTLRRGLTEFPACWNPHRCSGGADAEMLGYLSAGLYAFDYNEDRSGTRPIPCMAAGEPRDVTAEYVGAFGLVEGDEGRAWSIPLRQDLCWQDGSPIDAFDFVASALRLLDPKHPQPRSDLLCSGPLALAGARQFRESAGHIHLENATHAFYSLEDLSPGEDGVYRTPEGQPVSLALDFPLEHLLYGKTLRFYVETYGEKVFDLSTWPELLRRMDGDGLVPLTDESLEAFLTLTTGNPNWGDRRENVPSYLVCDDPAPDVSWTEVGIFAAGAAELVLVLEEPLREIDLRFALTETWLVCCDLYDRCVSEETGDYVNTYGTSPGTTMSCGPYVLEEYDPGNCCTLRKNPLYFGNRDEFGNELYETTEISLRCEPVSARRLELFRAGELDECAPGPADAAAWAPSELCRAIPGDTTYLLVLNPDLPGLEKAQAEAGEHVNKTILTLPDFRRALSLALDRETFCREVSPMTRPAVTLFTDLTLADPESGVPYRDTAEGKAAAEGFAESGGYDPERAAALFTQAWKEALASGLLGEEDVVELNVGIPVASDYYERSWDFLTAGLTAAVKGTPLEGRLRFTRTDALGDDSHAALRENRVDLFFGVGWKGDALDPYGLMEAYLSEDLRCDVAWDTDAETCAVTAGGTRYTASVSDWYALLRGETRTVTPAGGDGIGCSLGEDCPVRPPEILAALERAVLERTAVIPLSESCSFLLQGRRLRFPAEKYLYGVGFGGVKYLTYTYSDAEWEARRGSSGGNPNE